MIRQLFRWLIFTAFFVMVALPLSATADNPRIYVVEPGDTLASIASRFGATVADLRQLNGLSEAGLIRVGQELLLGQAERPPRVASRQTTLDMASLYGLGPVQLAAWDWDANPLISTAGNETTVMRPPAVTTGSRSSGVLTALYRSQFDGSPYDQANCGPVALGIQLGAYGAHWTTSSIRDSVEAHSGVISYDAGTTWEDLASAALRRGFIANGLFDGLGGYREWSFEELLKQNALGRPVMVLARFWSLPGHEDKGWGGDHYIIFLGANSKGDVVYHDPAWRGWQGANLTMTREQFERAWTRVSVGIQRSAMVLTWDNIPLFP